jgi:molecular chaperone GrpE
MENIRKRTEKEIKNIHKFSLEKFAIELLPILDSLNKAIEITNKTKENKSTIQGIKLTMKMFLEILKKFNIKEINPKGKSFDPNEHEAMAMQHDPKMKNNIIKMVLQYGYKLNDRIIRPARVIVIKNK